MSIQMFKKRAVIYTRVSRDDSSEGTSNDRQVAEGGPWATGARPYGYADDHITIVPEEAEAIREAARRALDDESMNSIGRWLTGLLPARGDSKV